MPPALGIAVRDSVTLEPEPSAVSVRNLRAWYGRQLVIEVAVLRNRMQEVVVGATVAGSVVTGDQDIYARNAKPILVRRHVGMVFRRANPLPTRSIYDECGARAAGPGGSTTGPG